LNFLNNLRKKFNHKAIVLMYHRITSPKSDPWQLAVNRENFEQHLEFLKNNYKIISIADLKEKLANKQLDENSICITFDDAYTDNYLYAKPLLEKHNCPATFFIPVHYINSGKLFWWDELKNILLDSTMLPPSISLKIGKDLFQFQLRDQFLSEELIQKHVSWVWPEETPTQRCELYLNIWERLQPLSINMIEPVVEEIKLWAAFNEIPDKEDLPMSNLQLEDLIRNPLFNVGIHTLTHPALSFHSSDIQRHEIITCRKNLEERSGAKIDSLAYPYGNYNEATLSIVKEEKIALAFTTNEEIITSNSDCSQLGRFQALNQNGRDFKKQMNKWLRSA
jgi:peptidoglycan/xylan/chitin deacetylase (PgdA/CDA1 family)